MHETGCMILHDYAGSDIILNVIPFMKICHFQFLKYDNFHKNNTVFQKCF